MAGERTLASARVKIIADASGLPEDVRRQTERGLGDAGEQGGTTFGRRFMRQIKQDSAQIINEFRGTGEESGRAFGKRASDAMTDAVGRGGASAGRKAIEKLNEQLRAAHVAEIPIDADTKQAKRMVEELQAKLKKMSANATTVEVKVDVDNANRALGRFSRIFTEEGARAGGRFGGAFSSVMQNLFGSTGPVGAIMIAGLVAVLAAAMIPIGAMIGSLVIAIFGLAFAGLGVFLIAQNKKVVAAFQAVWDPFFVRLHKAAGVFLQPVLDAIKIFDAALKKLPLESIFKSAATFVVPLAKGLASIVIDIGIASDELLKMAGPIMDAFSVGLGKIGKALKDGLLLLKDDGPALADAMEKLMTIISQLILEVFLFINAMVEAYAAVQKAAGGIRAAWGAVASWFSGTIVPSIKAAVGQLVGIWNSITSATVTAWNGVRAAIEAVRNWIVDTVWRSLQQAASQIAGIWNGIKSAAEAAWNGVRSVIGTVVNWIVSNVWPPVKAVIDGLSAAWHVYSTVVTTVWSAVGAIISFWVRTVIAVLTTLAGWIATGLSAAFNALRNLVTTVWTAIGAAISAAWNFIKGVFVAIAQHIAGALSAAFTVFRSLITTVWNAISSVISAVWNVIRGIFVAIAQHLAGPLSAAFTIFRSLMSTVWNAISATISTIWNAIRAVFLAIASHLAGPLSAAFTIFRGLISGLMTC